MQQDIGLIVALVLIAISAGAMLRHRLRRCVRDWQTQAERQQAHIQAALETIRKNLEIVVQTADHYPLSLPDPYQAKAQGLHQRLPRAQAAYKTINIKVEDLRTKSYHPPPPFVSWSLLGPWRQCRYWKRRCEAIQALDKARQDVQRRVNHLLELHRTLQEMPLKVAHQVKELQRAIGESIETGRELKTQGVYGEPLETALGQVQILKRELLTLPNYFLQGTETVVMKKASQEEVIASWQRVETLTHPIETQAGKFQRWRSKYHYIRQSLEGLQEQVQSAKGSLVDVSRHIDVEPLVEELTQIQRDAQAAQATFPVVNIEEFAPFLQEVRDLIERTKEIWQESEDLSHTLARLQRTLHQNTTMLEELRAEMDAMASTKVCPIIWEAYRGSWGYQDELSHLCKLDANTCEITDIWTPAELTGHMSIADKLNQKVLTLFHEVMRVRTQRLELIQYLRRPEFAPNPQWLKQAEDLSRQTGQYAPANWPKRLEVTKILEKARSLAQQRGQFVPAHLNDAVVAQELRARVEATRQLLHSLEIFENRLQHIASTLAFIQQTERNARQTLDAIRQSLVPLRQRLKDLKPLPTDSLYSHSPVSKTKRILKKLQRDSRRLTSKLKRQNRGQIRDKARAVNEWAAAYHKVLQDLPGAIQTEIAYMEAKLGDEIQELKQWAPLDNEPVLNTAQQRLARGRPSSPPPSGQSSQNQLEALFSQVTDLLQEREDLVNVLGNLHSQIRQPLEGPFETLGKLGPEAQKTVNALRALKNRAEATWPPLACDIQTFEDSLKAAAKNEEQVHRSGQTVRSVRQQLDTTLQQYRAVISGAQAQRDRVRQAQDDLRNELNRLARWQGQLNAYQQSHSDAPDIREAVRTRLNEIERAMRKAKRHYNKPLPPSEASRILQDLWTLAHQDLALPGSRHVIKVREIEKGG
jgi:DNA repair ATPase RecN